jgi:hypothetical protein
MKHTRLASLCVIGLLTLIAGCASNDGEPQIDPANNPIPPQGLGSPAAQPEPAPEPQHIELPHSSTLQFEG